MFACPYVHHEYAWYSWIPEEDTWSCNLGLQLQMIVRDFVIAITEPRFSSGAASTLKFQATFLAVMWVLLHNIALFCIQRYVY